MALRLKLFEGGNFLLVIDLRHAWLRVVKAPVLPHRVELAQAMILLEGQALELACEAIAGWLS